MKEIKKELRQLKDKKAFLDNAIYWKVNDLNFYNYLYQQYKLELYKNETQVIINYLDMTWNEYSDITERIKVLKNDLRNWKLVR